MRPPYCAQQSDWPPSPFARRLSLSQTSTFHILHIFLLCVEWSVQHTHTNVNRGQFIRSNESHRWSIMLAWRSFLWIRIFIKNIYTLCILCFQYKFCVSSGEKCYVVLCAGPALCFGIAVYDFVVVCSVVVSSVSFLLPMFWCSQWFWCVLCVCICGCCWLPPVQPRYLRPHITYSTMAAPSSICDHCSFWSPFQIHLSYFVCVLLLWCMSRPNRLVMEPTKRT